MIACTKARRLPGVRCCTSRTMAMLPLYFIACPFRRSFAAAINEGREIVESCAFDKRASALSGVAVVLWTTREKASITLWLSPPALPTGKRLQQLQLRQVLGIDNAHRDLVFVHDDQVIDPMSVEEVE